MGDGCVLNAQELRTVVVVVPAGLVGHTACNRSDWVQCRVLDGDVHCLVDVTKFETGLLTSVRVGCNTVDLRLWRYNSGASVPDWAYQRWVSILSVCTSDENQGVVPVVLFVVVEVHERSIHHDDLTGHVFYGSTVVTVFLVGSTVTIGHGLETGTCSEVVAA